MRCPGKLLIHLFILSMPLACLAQQAELVLPVGHTGPVIAARFSPDGKYVISGGKDKQVMIWETLTGRLVRNLSDCKEELKDVFFSNDGTYITAITDSTTYLWTFPAQKLVAKFHAVFNIVFSPDGKKLFTRDYKGKLSQYSLPGITIDYIYDAGPAAPNTDEKNKLVDISTDNRFICYANDSIITALDIKSGKVFFQKNLHTIIVSVYISPGDSKLVAVTQNGCQRIMLKEGAEAEILGFDNPNRGSVLSRNKKYLLCWAYFDNGDGAEFWDIEKEQRAAYLGGYTIYDTLADTDSSGNPIIRTGTLKYGFPFRPLSINNRATISDDGNLIFTFNLIWNNTDDKKTFELPEMDILKHSEFSPDSRYLLLQHENGELELWDVGANKVVVAYRPAADRVMFAELNAKGDKMLIGGYDSTVKQVDLNTGKTDFVCKGHHELVTQAVYSPDNQTILTNSTDSTARLWDAANGEEKNIYRHHHVNTSPAYFSADGKVKFASLYFDSVEVLDEEGNVAGTRTVEREYAHPENFQPRISKSGRFSFVTIRPDWQELDILTDTALLLGQQFKIADRSPSLVAFSSNEKWLAMTLDNADTLCIWDIQNQKWHYSGKLGISMQSKSGLTGISQLVFSPDNQYLMVVDINDVVHVVSTNDFNTTMKLRGHYCSFSENSERLAVVNLGVCDIYDFKKMNRLYSYVSINQKDFLTLDNKSRYDGTPAARKMLYYSCGKEIIDLEQFKDLLWVPDLASRIMKGDSINAKTLEQVNICNLTPKVERVDDGRGAFHFKIKPARGGLGSTIVYINGIEVRRYPASELKKNGEDYDLFIEPVELSKFFVSGGENIVTVKSYTIDNNVSSRGTIVKSSGSPADQKAPNLYAVMVGISDYKGNELDLKYAAKDANDLSNAISIAAKKMLNTDHSDHVFIYNLTSNHDRYRLPEKNAIRLVLEEIALKASPNDILLLFFAGHGVMGDIKGSDKKQFYFLTSDASIASTTSSPESIGISTLELTEWIKPQNIKAQKRVLIFDACNSGQAINDFVSMGKENQGYIAARNDDKGQQIKTIEKLNEQSGLFILSASASNQNAYEMGQYSQGLLTYSLLKAIKEQPDILQDGKYLDLGRWFSAAERSVIDITQENGARQKPQVVSNTNFNIGIVDAEVMASINLPEEKPLFTASVFLNNDEAIGDDDLDLSKMVNRELADVATRSANNNIIYITATNSPDAYTLTGRYEVKGESITVKVNLKKNKEIIKRFEIKGTKAGLESLVSELVSNAGTAVQKD